MKIALIISFVLSSYVSLAYEGKYYPDNFYNLISNKDVQKGEVKSLLHRTLSFTHQISPFGGNDTVVKGCNSGANCYRHKTVSYKTARKYLFGKLHLKRDVGGNFYIKDVYCNKKYTKLTSMIGTMGPMSNFLIEGRPISTIGYHL